MSYRVKEIFYTLQGEGSHTGRAAVFCRFTGCNLWNGREHTRSTAACTFCDTDFVGGTFYRNAAELAFHVSATWAGDAHHASERFVVCTGGEPLLQLDSLLVAELRARGFAVAVESNGTQRLPCAVDWVCVSPKAGTNLRLTSGDELKFVYPQVGAEPADYENLAFGRFSLQPMDGPFREENTRNAVAYCLANPTWRLSLQTHKELGIR